MGRRARGEVRRSTTRDARGGGEGENRSDGAGPIDDPPTVFILVSARDNDGSDVGLLWARIARGTQ